MVIEDLIREYGLWAVFFGVMIEGDLTLLFAGVLAHYGLFSFEQALATSTVGGVVGDTLCYLVGYRGKQWIKDSRFYQHAQPRLQKLSARFGIYSVFLVKYVYGLRTASAVFWGFAHMPFLRRFGPLTVVSCAAWALALISLGYFFSGAIGVIIGRVQRAGIVLLVGFVSACAISLALYLIERYVVGRRVPEMQPPLIAETLQDTLHDALHHEKTEEEPAVEPAQETSTKT